MEFIKQNYLDNLNQKQKEAIVNPDGPCLIVAGAGSGKTKVLTSRVVHIIKNKKAWPNQILCVTFTNKAAREMQNRISLYLKEKGRNAIVVTEDEIPDFVSFFNVEEIILSSDKCYKVK